MSESIKLIPAYSFDSEGFFDGETMWQVIGKDTIEAPSSTTLCPWAQDGAPNPLVFYRFVDGVWTKIEKPVRPEDLLGVVISHESMTRHSIEMRQLIQQFSDVEGFHQVRGEDLSWSIEKDPEPTEEEKRKQRADQIRAERDQKLEDTMWMLQRHQSEKQLGRETTLTEEEFLALLQYQQELRDVPQQEGFPDAVAWPVVPAFLG